MRASRATPLLALVLILAGCGSGEVAATSAEISVSAVDPGNAGGNKLVTVMTRNLYVGADLTPLITGGTADPADLWEDFQATNFPLRAAALAEEVAAVRPDVIGLQEAYRVDVTILAGGQPVGGDTVDFIDILLAELAARGLSYRNVIASTLLQVPVLIGTDLLVTVTDRDAILVREDLPAANARAQVFAVLAPLPPLVPGVEEVKRGWTEADVKVRGSWFRFVNAHLEIAEIPALVPLQLAQASELLGALPPDGPVILVGDFNADANASSPTYLLLTSVLGEAIPDGAPATCCQTPLLDDAASALDERVDLVLYRGPVTEEWALAVGTDPALLEEGPPFWASDHAGVVARLRVWDPEFYALRP